jgi:hypothetical protein
MFLRLCRQVHEAAGVTGRMTLTDLTDENRIKHCR